MHVSWVNYLVASKTMQSSTAESRMLVETQGRESDTDLWVVVIGRNEGERLTRCFDSIRPTAAVMVYVDSASTDDSVSAARERGIEVVELDMSIPFTAARARNAGFARLKQTARPARWIQFIDGDCEIIDGWFDHAKAFMSQDDSVACVCGGLRERYPDRSVYNRIADQAAYLPSGRIQACGGIAMMRADVFEQLGGFRDDLVAGEEPELCLRMRNAGWAIWRLAIPMAWHDSAMLKFGQWWKRTRRVGYTYAQAATMYGRQDPTMVRQTVRAWTWAAVIPAIIAAATLAFGLPALCLLAIYPLQVLRMAASLPGELNHRLWSASFLVLGKLPELLGQCQYWLARQSRTPPSSFHKS